MKIIEIVPTIIMSLSFISGIICAAHGDLKRTVYWLSAALITWSVL